MGKIEVVKHRMLKLSDSDILLREKRRKAKSAGELFPELLSWHYSFVKHLEHCPYCGGLPRISAVWDSKNGYEYKMRCCESGLLGCGDWYPQLSRAGLDWNYRVRLENGEPYKYCPHI